MDDDDAASRNDDLGRFKGDSVRDDGMKIGMQCPVRGLPVTSGKATNSSVENFWPIGTK